MSFDVDIEVRRGDRTISCAFKSPRGITVLFGPSGAGKTSVLEALAGIVKPERGHIAVAGRTLFDADQGIDLAPEKRGCGYVFQDSRLFPHRSVRANLLYGWRLQPAERRLIAPELAIGFLGIGHLLDRMPRSLSGGEAQRVAIGRALLSGPQFILMDEPLASLDASRRAEILTLIERIRDELGLPIAYVSHERGEVDRLADTIVPIGLPD
ncbi:MAG: ATP-binding cassette domain-containing protein [Novosphingobium sp.]|nr:ATP-binding cassette domain-containing protein [Novosphingobium sp.]